MRNGQSPALYAVAIVSEVELIVLATVSYQEAGSRAYLWSGSLQLRKTESLSTYCESLKAYLARHSYLANLPIAIQPLHPNVH